MRDWSASILPLMRASALLKRLPSSSNTAVAFGMTAAASTNRRHRIPALRSSPLVPLVLGRENQCEMEFQFSLDGKAKQMGDCADAFAAAAVRSQFFKFIGNF